MEEIEVGEYVRFNNGEIGKIIIIKENPSRIVYSEYGEIGLVSEISKHSKNIIDLIEVGDYVNGNKVKRIWEKINVGKVIDLKDDFLGLDDAKYIESILTHEQYENNCYRLEE